MTEIIGVRFKEAGKIYYFTPNGIKVHAGSNVVVETSRGSEYGEVVVPNRFVENAAAYHPLRSIVRIATKKDNLTFLAKRKKEREILKTFADKITEYKLSMKAMDAEYSFDGSKIVFYFTAESRVDFRDLVKELAALYRARIELRQIGVRDEAKKIGGIGVCGRKLCCSEFLGDFQPVSIKMAKDQSLSLNQMKISGTCGRLMCCLKYEQNCYEELLKITPKEGAYVETAEGRGIVEYVNVITGNVRVRLEKGKDLPPVILNRADVKIIRDARPRSDDKELEYLKKLE